MWTDHMGLNVLFPRELNSLEGLYYTVLGVSNCIKKVAETADIEYEKLKILQVMKTSK